MSSPLNVIIETEAAIAALSAAAFPVSAFDGCDRIAEIHKLLTDFIRFQTHVRLEASANLPRLEASANLPRLIPAPNFNDRRKIVKLLEDEGKQIQLLRCLLDTIDKENEVLYYLYNDPPCDTTQGVRDGQWH